ncbi:MAG: hypothetical protein U1F30_05685 [Steroidobacteraceae bacterium]
MRSISRRQLLASGVQATAALAVAGALGPAAASAAGAGGAAGAPEALPEILTFDPRFPVSRLRARALPGRPRLRPVQGDPTALLAGDRGARRRRAAPAGCDHRVDPLRLKEFAAAAAACGSSAGAWTATCSPGR